MKPQLLAAAALLCTMCTGASAQNALLFEACGRMPAAQRTECLEAAGAATRPGAKPAAKRSPPSAALPVIGAPLDLAGAIAACEYLIPSLKDRRDGAAEANNLASPEVLGVHYAAVDARPDAICIVNRQSRKVTVWKFGDVFADDNALAYLGYRAAIRQDVREGRYADFVARAKERLTHDFRDPLAVQYRDLYIGEGDGEPTLCGEFNGKNRFGVYVGFRRFYITEGNPGQTEPSGPDWDPNYYFNRTWPAKCGTRRAQVE